MMEETRVELTFFPCGCIAHEDSETMIRICNKHINYKKGENMSKLQTYPLELTYEELESLVRIIGNNPTPTKKSDESLLLKIAEQGLISSGRKDEEVLSNLEEVRNELKKLGTDNNTN